MTKAKAIKRLAQARESLNYWREDYVEVMRNKNRVMDLHRMLEDETLREKRIREARENMNEVKARIARLERIAL